MPRSKKPIPPAPKPKAARRKAVIVDKVPANTAGASKAIPKRRIGKHLTAFVAEVRAEIIGHLASGLPRYYACASAGINPKTMRRWMREGEQNLEEIDLALANNREPPELTAWGEFAYDVMVAEATSRGIDVRSIRASEDWRATAWYLERIDNRTWGGVSKHQLVTEGEDGEPVDAGALLLEQLDVMAERIGRAQGGGEDSGKGGA